MMMCGCLCAVDSQSYRAECRFVDYPSDNVPTNALGEVLQPPDFSGGRIEAAEKLISQVRANLFCTNIVAAFRQMHPESRLGEAELMAIATDSEIKLIGYPIPVFAVFASASEEDLARDMVSAYREAIRQMKRDEERDRLNHAVQQIELNAEKKRRDIQKLANQIAVVADEREKAALQREKNVVEQVLADLVNDGQKARDAAVRVAFTIHPLGEITCAAKLRDN